MIKNTRKAIYTGEVDERGIPFGGGIMTYSNGNVYDGVWGWRWRKNAMISGTIIYAVGKVGEVLNISAVDFNDGVYEGEVKDGKPNGWGKLTWHTSDYMYEGEWIDGEIVKIKMILSDAHEIMANGYMISLDLMKINIMTENGFSVNVKGLEYMPLKTENSMKASGKMTNL